MNGNRPGGQTHGIAHGYVLAGGRSSRMGHDKALLGLGGTTILHRTYEMLVRICGEATVVGPRDRYASLGLPLIEDLRAGCGPLAGIEAALADLAEIRGPRWALVVACDMPAMEDAVLEELLNEAGRSAEVGGAAVILPVAAGRAEPLSALYHERALTVVRNRLEMGQFKLLDAIAQLPVREVLVDCPDHFLNVNRPEDWEAVHARG